MVNGVLWVCKVLWVSLAIGSPMGFRLILPISILWVLCVMVLVVWG